MSKFSVLFALLLLSGCGSDNPKMVVAVNVAPVVGAVSDQQISANEPSAAVVIHISDDNTDGGQLQLSLVSSNHDLVMDDGLALTALTNGTTSLIITAISGQIGDTMITISVTDSGGLVTSTSFNVSVVTQVLSANAFIHHVFAIDKNAQPVSLAAITLEQDLTDSAELDDLIN